MIILLLLFWMALSGQTSLFFITSAVLSIAIAIFVDKKIFSISPLFIGIKWSCIVFISKLLKEMFVSSIRLIKIVWFNAEEVQPCCLSIEANSKDGINQVIQANSITLTPGTMTMQMQDNKILVHAINTEMLQELQQDEMSKQEQNT